MGRCRMRHSGEWRLRRHRAFLAVGLGEDQQVIEIHKPVAVGVTIDLMSPHVAKILRENQQVVKPDVPVAIEIRRE